MKIALATRRPHPGWAASRRLGTVPKANRPWRICGVASKITSQTRMDTHTPSFATFLVIPDVAGSSPARVGRRPIPPPMTYSRHFAEAGTNKYSCINNKSTAEVQANPRHRSPCPDSES